jgi:hypothetical protein
MANKKTYRLATPEEIEQINKDPDEAERLYFESGLSDEPQPLIVVESGAVESQQNHKSQEEHRKESQEKTYPVQPTKEEGSKSPIALKFKPYPPDSLKATQADLAAIEALVDKLGWKELMYRLGVLITRQAEETNGPHKGALEAAANVVSLWGPSFHWCDEQVCRELMDKTLR